MKYILLILLSAIMFTSCDDNGDVTNHNLNTDKLPPELKGLKVYTVTYNDAGNKVKVAVLDNKINSVTTTGKHPQTTIMVDVSSEKIVFESDSVIVLKKY